MKWFQRILGFLVALQCIGLYSGAISDFNMHLQGWHGPLGKSIFKVVLGTLFLIIGTYVIKSSFKSKEVVSNEE